MTAQHDVTTLTRDLMTLYPGDQRSHIRWLAPSGSNSSTNKRTVTVPKPLTPDVYGKHLCAASQLGPGALGVKLTFLSLGQRLCETLVLDLDSLTVEALTFSAVIDTLYSADIHPYVSRGSTGRGCHIHVFLREPVHLTDALTMLSALRHIVRCAVPDAKVETFPTGGDGGGKALYLPYRGAAIDGLGANPLLDVNSAFEAIPLPSVRHRIVRTEPDKIMALIAERPIERDTTTGDTRADDAHGDPHMLYQQEVERVRSHWKLGQRNTLVLALSGYAIMGLRINPDDVKRDVSRIHRASGITQDSTDTDEAVFLKTISRTANRVRLGKRVAWIPHYEAVGIKSPPPLSRPPQLEAKLAQVVNILLNTGWLGQTGPSDQATYWTLVTQAIAFGRDHDEGIIVRISRRDLTRHSNLSDGTLKRVVKRLRERTLVRTLGRSGSENAGSFILLCTPEEGTEKHRPRQSQQTWDLADTAWLEIRQHPAFRARCLGRTAALVVAALTRSVDSPLTIHDLAAQLHRPAKRLRKAIERLLEEQVVIQQCSALHVAENAIHVLDAVAERDGANRMRERQKERHEADREHFRHIGARRRSETQPLANRSRDASRTTVKTNSRQAVYIQYKHASTVLEE